PGLVALAGDLQPPALDALGIAPAEEVPHRSAGDFGCRRAKRLCSRLAIDISGQLAMAVALLLIYTTRWATELPGVEDS
ncbi:hypothetical protein J8I82_38060, partial [Cupriavidus sp. LEh25]|nr:hypothetical protein [Cupriavidus sp. LEh25]